jgi:hypothetical protein
MLRNTGQSSWPLNGSLRLGTDRTRDRASDFKANDWVNSSRPSAVDENVTVPGKDSVGPGETAKFSFSIENPATVDGSYTEYLRPVVEGVAWLPEDYGMYVPVTVQSTQLNYQMVKQDYSRQLGTLRYGEELTARLSIRNTGAKPWAVGGTNPVRLGATRPTDRGSGFAVLSGADAWESPSRASRIDARVASLSTGSLSSATEIRQGEVAYFNVPLKVPIIPTNVYNEYFNLVSEGISWFPDLGIYLPLNVGGPAVGI